MAKMCECVVNRQMKEIWFKHKRCIENVSLKRCLTTKNHKTGIWMHTVILNDIASGSMWNEKKKNMVKKKVRCIEQSAHFSAFVFAVSTKWACFSLKCCACHHSSQTKTKSNHTLWQSIENGGCYYFAHFYHLLDFERKGEGERANEEE